MVLDEHTLLASVTADGNVLHYTSVIRSALLESLDPAHVATELDCWASRQACGPWMMPFLGRGVAVHTLSVDGDSALLTEQHFGLEQCIQSPARVDAASAPQ